MNNMKMPRDTPAPWLQVGGNLSFVNPEDVYSHLTDRGISDLHALGILANIQGESDFNPAAVGDSGASLGLFQHQGPRRRALEQFGPSPTDWRQQVDFALSEPEARQYLSQNFDSPEQATEWWMRKFERPAADDSARRRGFLPGLTRKVSAAPPTLGERALNFILPAAQASEGPTDEEILADLRQQPEISDDALLADLGLTRAPAPAVLLPDTATPEERAVATARAIQPPSSDQRAVRAAQAEAQAEARRKAIEQNPALGLPWYEQLGRGAMEGVGDAYRGWGQTLSEANPVTRIVEQLPGARPVSNAIAEEVAAARKRNAPLMATPLGRLGSIAGQTAFYLPAGAGASRIRDIAALGGIMGIAQPHLSPEEAVSNAAWGAGTGLVGGTAGALGLGTVRGIIGAARPFFTKGAEDVALNRVRALASYPERIERAQPLPSVTGAKPTLADITEDPGVAKFQDWMLAQPGIGGGMVERLADNNAARTNALQRIAGTSEDREAAISARDAAAKAAYQAPKGYVLPVSDELKAILETPTGKIAMEEARTEALNRRLPFGIQFSKDGTPVTATGSALHDMKMALDALIDPKNLLGWKGAKADTAKDLRDDLLEEMKAIPGYHAAREGYAADSAPINQRDVASELLTKASAIEDLGGTRKLSAAQIARAFEDQAKLIKEATGTRAAGNRLEQVFRGNPEGLATLRAIAEEVAREASVGKAGMGSNSATYQRLAFQDVLSRMSRRKDFSTSPTALMLGGAFKILPSVLAQAEPRVLNAIERILREPEYASMLANRSRKPYLSPATSAYLSSGGRAAGLSSAADLREKR